MLIMFNGRGFCDSSYIWLFFAQLVANQGQDQGQKCQIGQSLLIFISCVPLTATIEKHQHQLFVRKIKFRVGNDDNSFTDTTANVACKTVAGGLDVFGRLVCGHKIPLR